MQRLTRTMTRLYRPNFGLRKEVKRSPSNSASCLTRSWDNRSAPPALAEGLLGFSSGIASEFRGCYEWSVPGQRPFARNVFCYREARILIFEPVSHPDFNQAKGEVVKVQVEPSEERTACLRAKGVAHVQVALLKELKARVRKKTRTALFGFSRNFSATGLKGLDAQIESNELSSLTYSSNESDHAKPEIIGVEKLFEILVLREPLDTIRRPLALFRKAANYLRRDGWLILGSTTYSADWEQPITSLSSDTKFIFSQNALIELSRVAGFEARRLIGLSARELECFGRKASEALDWIHTIVPTLFSAGGTGVSEENYVLLVCQRKF